MLLFLCYFFCRELSGHQYHGSHPNPLLRTNTSILRLPFEPWSLANIAIKTIIIIWLQVACVMKYYVATQIVNPNAGPLTLTSDSPGLSARSASSQIVIQLRSLRRKTKVAYAQDACRLRISSRPRLHIVGYPFRNSPNRSNGSGCTVHRPSHKRPTRDSLRTAC